MSNNHNILKLPKSLRPFTAYSPRASGGQIPFSALPQSCCYQVVLSCHLGGNIKELRTQSYIMDTKDKRRHRREGRWCDEDTLNGFTITQAGTLFSSFIPESSFSGVPFTNSLISQLKVCSPQIQGPDSALHLAHIPEDWDIHNIRVCNSTSHSELPSGLMESNSTIPMQSTAWLPLAVPNLQR